MAGTSASMELCLRHAVFKTIALRSPHWNGGAVEIVNTFCSQPLSVCLAGTAFFSVLERKEDGWVELSYVYSGDILISFLGLQFKQFA